VKNKKEKKISSYLQINGQKSSAYSVQFYMALVLLSVAK